MAVHIIIFFVRYLVTLDVIAPALCLHPTIFMALNQECAKCALNLVRV